MTSAQKLQTLLEVEIIPDIEASIDELFEAIDATGSATADQKEDLEELREMRTECFAILEELKRDELSQEEIVEIYEELVSVKTEDD